MKRILVTGTLAIDFIGRYEGTFEPYGADLPLNMSVQLSELEQGFGGCAMNIAYTLKLLGFDPIPLVRVGTDFEEGYHEHLTKLDICTDAIVVDHRLPFSSRAFIITDDGGNQITAFFPGSSDPRYSNVRVPGAGDVAKQFGCEYVILAPDLPQNMISHARSLFTGDVPYLSDPGQGLPDFSNEHTKALVELSRETILNEYEWRRLVERTQGGEKALRAHFDWIAVTHGAEGVDVYAHSRTSRIAAVKPQRFVEHTGCGDAFRAAFIGARSLGVDLERCARVAVLAATIKLESPGTQLHRVSIEAFRKRYRDTFGETAPI
jgi:adenosine kinase